MDWIEKAVQWCSWDPNPITRSEVQNFIDRNDIRNIECALGQRLQFGTAGLRGPMGAGSCKMNDLVVIQTTQGLSRYLEDHFGSNAKAMGVVIGHDHRATDSCSSSQFAQYIAAVLLERGFKVYAYQDVVATPFVPFAVERLRCCAGIMVTASHNPKQDNGYKLYWSNGAQIIPPHDEEISKMIQSHLKPDKRYNPNSVASHPNFVDVTQDLVPEYFKTAAAKLCRFRESNYQSELRITYTAMHGVGHSFAQQAFKAFGLPDYFVTESQVHPDPDFPTVVFPNPEEGKGALSLAMATAESVGSRLVLANDPDADRLAVAERIPDGTWKVFTGNEIGVLLGYWEWLMWQQANPAKDCSNVYMVGSTVSTSMLGTIAKQEGFRYVETLTGFKWMGNKTEEIRKNGGVVLFSFEEAIGFCVGDVVKDKDGITAAVVFAEMADQLSRKGITVAEQLRSLYVKYGYHVSVNSYLICNNPLTLDKIFDEIRNKGNYQESCGGVKIVAIRDLTVGYDSEKPSKVADLPFSGGQMVTFKFENSGKITFRTSGTEPKLKYYSEMIGTDILKVQNELENLVDAAVNQLLQPDKYKLERRAN